MEPAILRAIKANLFPAAHDAVASWHEGLWHMSGGQIDTMRPNSSQALAIDVFGTVQASHQAVRDAVLGKLALDLQLPPEGPWQIELEWIDPLNRLRETGTPSQIDAVASSPHSLIFVECKFTEQDGGCCSQTNPIGKGTNKGKVQCNGKFEWQVNPVNGRGSKCALTGKGIAYWEVVPNVLRLDPSLDYRPCPFSGSMYQWMRNLSSCWLRASARNLAPGFLVVYADAPHLPMAQKVRSQAWHAFQSMIRHDRIRFGTRSFQHIVHMAKLIVGDEYRATWDDLQEWIDQKLARTCKP